MNQMPYLTASPDILQHIQVLEAGFRVGAGNHFIYLFPYLFIILFTFFIDYLSFRSGSSLQEPHLQLAHSDVFNLMDKGT